MTNRRFVLVWLAAATAAFVVYYFWNVHGDFIGVVETRTHKLGAQEDGRIRALPVALGEEVETGQLVAEMEMADLEEERAWLAGELARVEALQGADRQRYALEYEKLRLQRDADAANINRRRAELEAKRGELEALDTEVTRLQGVDAAGLGRPRDLSSLTVRRDSTRQWVESEQAALSAISQSHAHASDGIRADDIIASMLDERMERLGELRLRLKTLESQISRRRVHAPCDGRVVKINTLPGDVVEAFSTILTIEEPHADFVDAYIPETSEIMPALGQRVVVHPRRIGKLDAEGVITFVDPGYSEIPTRLAFRNLTYWARKFRVRLNDGHQLMPGEATQVELFGDVGVLPQASAARPPRPHRPAGKAARPVVLDPDGMAELDIPRKLRKKSNVEPSGIVWLNDIERYAIVSDDTSRHGKEHAPWILLMDADGKLDKKPAQVEGIDQLNDLESIAGAASGDLYVVSSQNVSKQGKRPNSRQQIVKIRRNGRDFEVVASTDILAALARSYDTEQLHTLGLGDVDEDGRLVLNIEGATWRGEDLLLGLKQPRPRDGALIWRLRDADRLLERHSLLPGQLTLFGRVDLRTPDGRPAAVSDLVVDDRGDLFVLSTIPKAGKRDQVGVMHRIVSFEGPTLSSEPLYAFPTLKPEGICSLGNGRFTVVFDTDNELPIPYVKIEVPQP